MSESQTPRTLVDGPRSDEVEELCSRLESAFSTVFERSLAREAASMLRKMDFLRTIARTAMRRAELAEAAEQDIECELRQAQERVSDQRQGIINLDAVCGRQQKELAQSQARCAEVEKDAARYTWLANALCGDNGDAIGLCLDADSLHLSKEAFDASVDAALAGHTPK